MGKLLKFLKPYAGAVVAIICILVVQAYCDLSLPTYTSDIVNVGIQQGGIDETVPDTISKKDLNHLLLLVPSDKQELVKNAYTKSTKKYDYKGTVMELKSSVKEDDKKMKLSDILGKPMLLAAGFDSGSDMTQRIEDQMRTNMKKQVEAKQAEAKAQMEKAQKEAEDKINAQFADALAAAQTPEAKAQVQAKMQAAAQQVQTQMQEAQKKAAAQMSEVPDFDKMDERTLSMNRLAAGIVMTCKGMPFFQAGEEFARTKHGEGNSFKSSWQLNKIDWTRALEQEELVDYYRGLLALRRKFQAYGTCEPDCKKTFFRENQIAGYELEYPDGHAVCVFYNPWEKEALQKLPEGNWKLLCDGKRCAEDGAEMKESMMLPAKSMVLLARE